MTCKMIAINEQALNTCTYTFPYNRAIRLTAKAIHMQ